MTSRIFAEGNEDKEKREKTEKDFWRKGVRGEKFLSPRES